MSCSHTWHCRVSKHIHTQQQQQQQSQR
jgi:hypothetical protein